MAKLSAHDVIGKIDYMYKTIAYCEDKKVLVNYGDGYKVYGKIKPDIMPIDAYNQALKKQAEFLKNHPCYNNYRKFLHSLSGLNKRFMIHQAVKELHNDSDSLFSSFDDFSWSSSYPHLELDDCAELCKLYNTMITESKFSD
jgi:hypothetical protein